MIHSLESLRYTFALYIVRLAMHCKKTLTPEISILDSASRVELSNVGSLISLDFIFR